MYNQRANSFWKQRNISTFQLIRPFGSTVNHIVRYESVSFVLEQVSDIYKVMEQQNYSNT